MSTKTKHSLLLVAGAVLFMIGWYALGEWDVVENMSSRQQLWVSLGFLVMLGFISYRLITGGRKQ